MTDYRIGIDVGGTNTDAVVMDGDDNLLAKTKTPTTEDITSGILSALDVVLDDSGVSEDELDYVMLGTTHATNAITERRGLNEVGVIRIGAPATQSIRPLLEWPDDLAAAIGNNVAILDGGHEFDGRLLNDLDEEQVRAQIREFSDVDAFAVTSVFSPVRDDHETRVAELIREEVGDDVPISVSNEIGSVGLLERENATALNAALTSVASEAANAFVEAMDERGIDANLYFGQNDGTLMSVDYAIRYPIFTVASGPSNSVRGAAYLSQVENGIIVDVGGTTTDVGAVTEGFPRESSVAVEIGEVKTNFRMPDIIAIGIGGGSIVSTDGGVTVGPQSVGYKLTEEARCFGGETLTATDLEVAAGTIDIGSETPAVDDEIVEAAREYVRERVEREVDRMKTSADPVPVVIVGGGSILVPDDIAGASEVHKPDHYEVANAVGVAIAQVSGEVDRIYSLDEMDREGAIQHAKDEATDNALAAGADPDSVDIVDIEEVPLSYLPGNAVRIKVKAAGALDH
ncbi:hydantoinase/oxoprolinase N-terminal domain-containing protein [Haloferax volcanii]|uniref:Hydantoinase/oxoprolinase family protein n=1 Tax=Haloferax volcanii TaxID=2246 RepID=A0A847TX73_HALVO|nr:hydantoinase/oxoprolinase family protein [Haloferax alexandrinus]NLV03251.1 hydantoinase/oxoprolinase family protein [Haloferax alexandrinus]